MFAPFQRLGDTEPASGIGLGLGVAVSHGLTEAMRGTLEPDETPGGGLTMIMSVPAAPGLAPPAGTAWWPASPSPDRREQPDDHDRRYAS
jgi:two-component system sensor histidine kinase KdpD